MADASIGTAYLQVVPKMSTGELVKDAERAGTTAGGDIGEGIGSGIGAKSVVIGNIVTDAIRSAVGAAIDVGKQIAGGIYEGFSANEQLTGGMQKLFGDDATAVIQNANDAWKTAGMSANEYMEGVTSFAAALVDSTGGDTAEAARLADVAMRAMSDNVSTFGTDAESVQNAIKGLAKENYMMLDNLSLPFAGTKQGMMDLINASGVLDEQLTDTSQLSEVGFGTMVEAIQRVQEQYGIAGTTAKEAMGTLEGSATATKAAWENVLTAIGTGDASQVQSATEGLMDALFGTIDEKTGEREGGLIENVTALAQRAFDALGAALPGMLDTALDAMPPEIGGPLREAFETIGNVVETIGPVVVDAISAIVGAVQTIAPVVAPLLPIIAGAMAAVKIVGVVMSIVSAVSGFISMASAAIGMISGLPALIGAIVTLLGGPVTIIAAIVGAIIAFIATNEDARNKVIEVWTAIKDAVVNFVLGMANTVLNKWNALKVGVIRTVTAIKTTVSNIWNAIKSTVSNVVSGITSTVTSKFNALKSTVAAIFNGVKSAITDPINTAKSVVSDAIERIKSIINGAHLELPKFKLPHFNINGGKLPWGIGGKGSPPSISVDWYARGGYVDDATLIGAGERGGELIWPSYAPYLDRYADALAARINGVGNVYVNGTVNDAPQIRAVTKDYLMQLARLGAI